MNDKRQTGCNCSLYYMEKGREREEAINAFGLNIVHGVFVCLCARRCICVTCDAKSFMLEVIVIIV